METRGLGDGIREMGFERGGWREGVGERGLERGYREKEVLNVSMNAEQPNLAMRMRLAMDANAFGYRFT